MLRGFLHAADRDEFNVGDGRALTPFNKEVAQVLVAARAAGIYEP
jgi:hypothetical protein